MKIERNKSRRRSYCSDDTDNTNNCRSRRKGRNRRNGDNICENDEIGNNLVEVGCKETVFEIDLNDSEKK